MSGEVIFRVFKLPYTPSFGDYTVMFGLSSEAVGVVIPKYTFAGGAVGSTLYLSDVVHSETRL